MPSALHDPTYRAFVAHLVQLRLGRGLTQRDLAERLDRQQSYVAKTERCERRMDPVEFRAIVLALGADPAEEFAKVSAALDGPEAG
jgi:transcriptional regulator with XRE-family HTH domain